ncbi:MAG: pilus assembly protein PilM [Planctomycetaceae bacterium]
MPDFLALDWDSQQVCGVAAQVGRKTVRVKQCFFSHWPEDVNPATNPAAAGAWLKQQLQRQGIHEADALVSLPREAVSVKPLQLPNVPDDELAEAVRLQAATRSPLPLDQLMMDYLPVQSPVGGSGRRVLVATLPKAVFERAARLAEAAGVKVLATDMAPLAVATLVRRASRGRSGGTDGLTLVVSHHGQRIEILLLTLQSLVFSYATTVNGNDLSQRNRALSIEVDRCLIAAEPDGAAAGLKVERIWLLGGESDNSQLSQTLEKRFSCAVSTSLDPFADSAVSGDTSSASGNRWSYAPPVGLLLNRAGCGGESIDFLNPRKPVVKRSRGKLRAGLAAAAVAALLGAGFAAVRMEQSDLDAKIDAKLKLKGDLDKKIADGKDALESAKSVERWLEQDVNWIEEFRRLKASFDAANGIFLSDFKVSPATRGELLSWRATGFARKEQDVRALYQKLHEQNYRVMPYATPQANKADPEYPFQFELLVEMVRDAKSPAVAAADAPGAVKAEEQKPAETKKEEAKATETQKPAEAKSTEPEKPADAKPAEAPKPAETNKAPDADKATEPKPKEAQPAAETQPAPVAAGKESASDEKK